MTVQAYPDAPPVTGLQGTLLDAATVRQVGDYRMIADTDELWQSFNCIKFDAETGAWCAAEDPPKEFSTPGWISGFRFAAYGGITCSLIGFDLTDAQAKARAVFTAGESTGVERALMRGAFAEGPTIDTDPLWEAATDLTPAGGAVAPAVGMALLEGFMADNYVGVPTLHIPRTVGSLLATGEKIEMDGNVFRTKLGAKVAAGAGYDFPNLSPAGVPNATATERWLYASGEVFVMPGEMIVKEAVDHTNNKAILLVERPYMAAIDCLTAAVRVTLSA